MPYSPDIHRRRSIRLDGFDYASAGAYFITICTANRECLFGDIANNKMSISAAGTIVESCWQEIPGHFPNLFLDAFVVMPNHLHGIIFLQPVGKSSPHTDPTPVGATHESPLRAPLHPPGHIRPTGPGKRSIGAIVGLFKSTAAKGINVLRETPGASIWQRNYYERIIRNERECNAIREYIEFNPMHWAKDEHYVGRVVDSARGDS